MITLQGAPATILFEGMSLVTIEPAAINTLSPMVTPFSIVTPLPVETLFPIVTLPELGRKSRPLSMKTFAT